MINSKKNKCLTKKRLAAIPPHPEGWGFLAGLL